MIIATAGHVNHGKTALVKALTGVDTDRLEEERRRGMTITLGYAYRKTAAGHSLGFIDVPGHRRFLNTMIAGVSGIDLGLLVVDAREGIKPQTLEHLQVMRLLGVSEFVIAITRVDAADAAARQAAAEAIGQHLPTSPVFPVSALTGEGIAALADHLEARAAATACREAVGMFRLSVDRAFVLKGVGLVVTGTVAAGQVKVGDSLRFHWAKGQGEGVPVRVRGLHAQDQPATVAGPGQRCALNLSGDVAVDDIERGDWLCDPDGVAASLRVDALCDAPTLRPHQTVKLMLGAQRIAAQAQLLDDQGRVQFLLARPVPVVWGERLLIRDEGENIILGGGRVLSPDGPRRGKAHPRRLRQLAALQSATPFDCLQQWVHGAGEPLPWSEFRRSMNLSASEGHALWQRAPAMVHVTAAGADHVLAQGRWDALRNSLVQSVAQWHEDHPHEEGIPVEVLLRQGAADLPLPLAQAALTVLTGVKGMSLRAGRVALPDFQSRPPPGQEAAWGQLVSCLQQGGSRIPLFSEIEKALPVARKELFSVINRGVHEGRLHRVSPRRVTLPDVLTGLRHDLSGLAERGSAFSVIDAKIHLGLGRDLTIEILEYFDSVKFTRREGNSRCLVT